MSDIICVTNSRLCEGDFLSRIGQIAGAKPRAILLREKEVSSEEYEELAVKVGEICDFYECPLILHSYTKVALNLGVKKIHLPLHLLRNMEERERAQFELIGTSCHSQAEVEEAERLGAGYVILGHIFATDCKKGLEPRGLDFLREVCEKSHLPVYAIGGIDAKNIALVRATGAEGACLMSSLMLCKDVGAYMKELGE